MKDTSDGGGFFKKFAESLKDQSGKEDDLKTSVRKFEETLTEIKELESVKRAKEAFAKAKVPKVYTILSYIVVGGCGEAERGHPLGGQRKGRRSQGRRRQGLLQGKNRIDNVYSPLS